MRRLLFFPIVLFLAGCGGGEESTKPVTTADGLPAGTPKADSPAHLMQRFEATWESQVESQYELLLTDDFHYKFSAASDPVLVNQFPNWGRDDEEASTKHLFDGFTNSSDLYIPGASRIELTLTGVSQGQDFDHPDSAAQYQRIVVTSLSGTFEVPSSPDPVVYPVNARHEFYLVRGDAAVLPTGATADSTRWYIRRWDDLAQPMAVRKGPVINPARAATLGSIKALYR